MFPYRLFSSALLIAGLVFIAGCGGSNSDCGATGLNVTPSSGTADHIAAAPANSQIFSASFLFSNQSGCSAIAITPALANSNWTASDPSVHLSASPTTQVTATCTAAVASPVTITATTATGQMFTGQASLTCK